MRRLSVIIMSMIPFCVAAAVSEVWHPDNGDGTYNNPVIHADYSDPDVCAAADGNGFYMTASSFVNVPGLPILYSPDLVNWEIVNYALPRLTPDEFFDGAPRHGKGVWAPSIRCHDGKYYIYWGDPDFGIYMVTTDDPRGKWTEPVLVKGGRGMIDATPLWDDDGRLWLVHAWAGSRAGFNSVLTVVELSVDGKKMIGEPVMVYDGNDGVNHTIEGPKLYKRNGWYYIFSPAGGVVDGWQTVLRSRSVFGPYEPRIVMSQGRTEINGPHQGAWVETPSGESWFLHFQDKDAYGRVVHLQPMTWLEDWPVIGVDSDGDGCGEPVSRYRKPSVGKKVTPVDPDSSDDFSRPSLGLQWQWSGNPEPWSGFPTSQGFYRLYSHILSDGAPNMWESPSILTQKLPAEKFTATAKVKVSTKENSDSIRSGLMMFGLDYSGIAVMKCEDGFKIVRIECRDAEHGGKEVITPIASLEPRRYEAGLHANLEGEVWLRLEVAPGGECTFAYSLDGKKFTKSGSPFKAAKGKWIGAKLALFSVAPYGNERGWMDIDSFKITKK